MAGSPCRIGHARVYPSSALARGEGGESGGASGLLRGFIGYAIQPHLERMGVTCVAAVPALIATALGDQVKTTDGTPSRPPRPSGHHGNEDGVRRGLVRGEPLSQ